LTDPEEAVAYLNAGLEDSLPSFLKALKNVTQAHQMTKIAKDSGVQRETLYRSLSEQGNPTVQTLTSVLTAMGLRIKIEPDATDNLVVSAAPRVARPKARRKDTPDSRRKQVSSVRAGQR